MKIYFVHKNNDRVLQIFMKITGLKNLYANLISNLIKIGKQMWKICIEIFYGPK